MKRFGLLGTLAVILAAGVGAILWNVFKPVHVSIAKVKRGPAVATVFATGSVEARERRLLRPPRQGIVAEVLAREWTEVHKGQALVRLRDTGREIRRDRARAEIDLVAGTLADGSAFRTSAKARIAEAKENEDQAQREVVRNADLVKQGIIQQSMFDDLQSKARALSERVRQIEQETMASLEDWEARRRKAQADLETIAAQERDDVITSPIDGIVLDLLAEEGEAVNPEHDVVKVGDIRDLIVECDVDEDDIARVRTKQEVIVRLAGSGDNAVKGEVFELLPDADRGTKSFRVKVRFPEAKFTADKESASGMKGRTELPGGLALYSGLSAELGIVVARREGALVFPRSALTSRGTVWVVDGGRASDRKVSLGIRGFDFCEALDGLAEGETVVTEGVAQVKPGSRLSTVEAVKR